MKPIQRILVATDFSACADAAAEIAAQLARQLRATVEMVTVVDISWVTDASGDPVWHRQQIDQYTSRRVNASGHSPTGMSLEPRICTSTWSTADSNPPTPPSK